MAIQHDHIDAHVELRIKLPVVGSTSKRLREIDVLLTSHVAGYPILIAYRSRVRLPR